MFYCEYIPKNHLSFILGSALIETKEQKFKRKIAANPLIPLGTAITTGVLMVSVLILGINFTRKKIISHSSFAAQCGKKYRNLTEIS